MSSGVGRQLSVRAHAAGAGLYRVERSLTVHDGSPSLMNAEARRRWPMETVGFVDGEEAARVRMRPRPEIFASLATVPWRERSVRRVVDSLLAQVDLLGVYLNGHRRIPSFLEHDRILVAHSDRSGLLGDAGKFFWAGRTRGYHLVCDDDIAYPDDYVERLVEGIERHGRRAVVGFHGSVLREVEGDYHTSRRLLHFARALGADTPVHVLGTGVAGYHSATLRVRPSDFRAPNMADVWLALLGQRQHVPFVCLRRPRGWLAELPGTRADSIYARVRSQTGDVPTPETVALRKHGAWMLHGRRAARPRPGRAVGRRQLVRLRIAGPRRAATLVLPARDHITAAVRRTGTYYERDLLDAIRTHGASGVFVDVGAHYGNHTTYFALECPCEQVLALEPHGAAFAGLLETVAANGLDGRVAASRIAAHPGWRSVTAVPLSTNGRSRTNSGQVVLERDASGAGVPAAPLDEVLADAVRVALIKVDVCGRSAEVVSSAAEVLRRDRPLVAAEAATDGDRAALRVLLEPLGYREHGPYCWTPTWLWSPA